MVDIFNISSAYQTRGDGTLYLEAYAWPGGYPILYLDSDDCVLCPACASKAIHSPEPEEEPCSCFIHYTGPPEQCADCHTRIASAYGDPEAEQEE